MVRSAVSQYPRSTATVAFLLLWFLWPRSDSPLQQGSSSAKCSKVGKRHGIMFDAGSTGSRVHVYHFDYGTDGSVKLDKELFEQLKPGLSSYPDDPKAAADSLTPLIDKALADLPRDALGCTPVALKATAGLRLLGEEKSNKILAAVRRKFAEYPFRLGKDGVVVMDGKDEGPFAWLTVNFLLGTLTEKEKKTAGIIDLGGGSTQLVFEPHNNPAALGKGPGSYSYDVSFLGRKFKTYQNSYLGFGLREAEKRTMKAWIESEGKPNAFPCFPADFSTKLAGSGITVSNENGEQGFDSCVDVVRKLFKKKATCAYEACSFNGVFQPSIKQNFAGNLLAFSYYYDRLEPWLSKEENNKVAVKTIADLGRRICGGDLASEHNKEMTCLDFSYLYALVSVGYELPDDYTLHVLKKINGVETAWCLGAMILEM